MYPSADVATIEFDKKWVPEFLPTGDYKTSDEFGWKEVRSRSGQVDVIHFHSGVSVYFKTYSQKAQNLQSGSVDAIFCDEELPIDLYDELNMRLAAKRGYFSMVFTATLNQEFWYKAMECTGDQETLKEAWKKQVSMYDCLHYKDGSPSPWTVAEIKRIEARCKSQAEIMRRVHGRFVTEEGRKYHAFDPTRHYISPRPIDPSWHIYTGVDIGSGGTKGHPSSIVFIAVRPDHQLGYVFKGWRGDGVQTTSSDVLEKYQDLKGRIVPRLQTYDPAARDFGTIAARMGEGFVKAEKSHELGEDILNTLFKNDMLLIFDTEELRKLGSELLTVMKSTPKQKAKDDFCDATRYPAVLVPWDFEGALKIVDEDAKTEGSSQIIPMTDKEIEEDQIRQRRAMFFDPRSEGEADPIEDELEEWNALY